MVIVKYSRRYSQYALNIQKKLKGHGYYIVTDGYFGRNSVDCLKEFQADRGLYVDGVAGPNTQKALSQPGKCKLQGYTLDRQTKVFKMRKETMTANKINTLNDFGKRRLSVYSIWKRLKRKPDLIVNGGLFAMNTGIPMNIAKDENKKTGLHYFAEGGVKISQGGKVSFGFDDQETKDFLGGSPMLHYMGKLVNKFKDLDYGYIYYKHPRQYMCEDDEYFYVIFVYGRSSWRGWKGESLKYKGSQRKGEAVKTIEKVSGGKNSVVNDGGDSIQGRKKNGKNAISPLSYRAVPNAMAFYIEGRK